MTSELLAALFTPWLLLPAALFTLLIGLWRAAGHSNEVDWGGASYNRIDGLVRLYCRRFQRLHGDNLYLPESGPAIVVANHISGIDPLLLIATSKRPLRFIIAREHYQRFGFTWLFRAAGCIPVDRVGRPERAFRDALNALQRGEVVALFPHGTIHLDTDPPRRLKGGAARMAQLADCPIFPVRIDGVKGQGHIFRSLFLRGRAMLQNGPPIECGNGSVYECLEQVRAAIERPPE